MPICKKCNKSFPTLIKIEEKTRNLCNRKYCLTCSPFGQHNTAKLHSESNELIEICEEKNCDNKRKSRNKFCSRKCKNKHHVRKRRKKVKEVAVAYKGGKCTICGYNKCLRSLTFHHLDPLEKDLGLANMTCKSWKAIYMELDKCELLCANCHGEIEEEIANNK